MSKIVLTRVVAVLTVVLTVVPAVVPISATQYQSQLMISQVTQSPTIRLV